MGILATRGDEGRDRRSRRDDATVKGMDPAVTESQNPGMALEWRQVQAVAKAAVSPGDPENTYFALCMATSVAALPHRFKPATANLLNTAATTGSREDRDRCLADAVRRLELELDFLVVLRRRGLRRR